MRTVALPDEPGTIERTVRLRIHLTLAAVFCTFIAGIPPAASDISPTWTVNDTLACCSVTAAGDVNGDGYADFAMGGTTGPRLYYGSPSGPSISNPSVIVGQGPIPAGVGDVNGDGYMDLAVYSTSTPSVAGAIALFAGGNSGLGLFPITTISGPADSAAWGSQVIDAGDVNGDGYEDIVVSSPTFGGSARYGRVQLYLGSSSGLQTSPTWTYDGAGSIRNVGIDVCSGGDMNGDGRADLAVKCTLAADPSPSNQKGVLLFPGTSGGFAGAPTWTDSLPPPPEGPYGPEKISGPADVNGDGYGDVVFSWFLPPWGATGYILGSASTPTVVSSTPVRGHFVGVGGDLNGDGRADLVVRRDPMDCGFGCGTPSCLGLPCAKFPATILILYGGTTEIQPVLPLQSAVFTGVGDVNGDGFDDFSIFTNIYSGHALGQAVTGTDVPSTGAGFGSSVARIGDLNADGYDDVAVGSPSFGISGKGRVSVFLGSATGIPVQSTFNVYGPGGGAALGTSVSGAGDVNGDGYDDLVMGAPGYSNGESEEGAVALLYGAASPDSIPDLWMESNVSFAHYGQSVAGGGDVNGDGYGDVLVGAPGFGASTQGRAFLYSGSGSGLATSPAWTMDGTQVGATLGQSVSSAGDVNRDGYSDVLIGEPGISRVRVYHGSSSGLRTTSTPTLVGTSDFGSSVAAAGDVNGDGYGDAIVGTPMSGNSSGTGHIDLFQGAPDCLVNLPVWSADGGFAGDHLGTSVAGIGDVDDDGFSDVAAGAPSSTSTGYVAVYNGSAQWLPSQPTAKANGFSGVRYGVGLTGADIDGDGFSDLLVGVVILTEPGGGLLRVFSGGRHAGRPRLVRQARYDNGGPLALLGRSAATAFRIHANGSTAYGRSRVRFQWQTHSLGNVWSPIARGFFQDTGAPQQGGSAVAMDQPVVGLAAETPYAWRVRVLGTSPTFTGSPWLSVPGNGPHQSDLRTGSLIAGDVPHSGTPGRIFRSVRPNPSSDRATVLLNLPAGSAVSIDVFDIQGRRVRHVYTGRARGGLQEIKWDGRNDRGDLARQGIYLVKLHTDAGDDSRKITILR